MNIVLHKHFLNLALLLSMMGMSIQQVAALELVVSQNGAGSTSEVAVEEVDAVVVQQTNDTSVETVIDVTQHTGDNVIDGSTGSESTIVTGDIVEDISIEHEVNESSVDVSDCCGNDETQILIVGNGKQSTNSVSANSSNVVNVVVTQTSSIEQTYKSESSTGGNTIKDTSGGDAHIETGDIDAQLSIETKQNSAHVEVDCCSDAGTFIKIANNGDGSINRVVSVNTNVFDILISQSQKLVTALLADYDTGNNYLSNVTGGTQTIITGDIAVAASVSDEGSTSTVEVTDSSDHSCDPNTPPSDNDSPEDPVIVPPIGGGTRGGNGGGSGGDAGGTGSDNTSSPGSGIGGSVLGMAQSMLPATGADGMLAFLIANILTLFFGCYLRLRSGRSPALKPLLVYAYI